jgi:hypothetical protein
MTKKKQPARRTPTPAQTETAARPAASSVEKPAEQQLAEATTQVRDDTVIWGNRGGGRKVRATKMGYYDHERRRPGDVFVLHKKQDFSAKWMEYVRAETPTSKTSPNQAIAKEHDNVLADRHGGGRKVDPTDPHTDNAPDDLEDTGDNPLDAS